MCRDSILSFYAAGILKLGNECCNEQYACDGPSCNLLVSCALSFPSVIVCLYSLNGAWGSVVVKALCS